jgi:hypothetical protein
VAEQGMRPLDTVAQIAWGGRKRPPTAQRVVHLATAAGLQVDAPCQRDVRAYQSNFIQHEHASLAEAYLADLKRLTARFLGLRGSTALIQVVGFGLALSAALFLISQGQLSLASFAVLIPGIAWLVSDG